MRRQMEQNTHMYIYIYVHNIYVIYILCVYVLYIDTYLYVRVTCLSGKIKIFTGPILKNPKRYSFFVPQGGNLFLKIFCIIGALG